MTSAAKHRDSIDQRPLTGRARTAFEKRLHTRYKLKAKTWHLLEVLLNRFHWGKADSFPSIAGLMEWLPGWSECTVRRHLHALRDAKAVRLFEDRSIHNQRRIVLVDHPHGQVVIDVLVGNANIREMLPADAPRGVKTNAPRGVKTNAPRGVKVLTHEPLTVEAEIGIPFNGEEISTPNGERLVAGPAPGTPEWIHALGEESAKKPGRLANPSRRPTAAAARTIDQEIVNAVLSPQTRQDVPEPIAATPADRSDVSPPQERQGAAFTYADEQAMVEALRAIGPGSTKAECQKAALILTMRLHDAGSSRFWGGVVNDVRLGKIKPNVFLGVADPSLRDPRRIIVARVKKARGARP